MPYLAFDLSLMGCAGPLGNMLGLSRNDVLGGLLELQHCAAADGRPWLPMVFLVGSFGAGHDNLASALEAFGVIEVSSVGWRARKPARVVLLSEARCRRAHPPLVYFVAAGAVGPIKIGYTTRLAHRLCSLQTSHHEELRLLASAPGTRANERALHERFAAQRMAGEWFERSPDLVSLTEEVSRTGRLP